MGLFTIFIQSLKATTKITLIILGLMIVIELLVVRYKQQIINLMKKNKFFGYVLSSFFGIIPGCIGTFAMDSLYMSGLLGFGGIVATMIATSGDEAFILIGMAAKGEILWINLILIITVLFILGIVGGILADYFKKKTKMKFCRKCEIINHKNEEFQIKHFLKEHVFNHILKKHIWQIFIWLFVAIFIIELSQDFIHIDFTGQAMFYVLIVASLVGLLPISGPNIFLVVMFSKGLIPFSVLLANSIIQDGHGLLPIMGFSMDDAVKIKVFNFVFGLLVGVILLSLGV